MKHVFLDCGANDGSSVRMFRSNFPEAEKYIIHSFEPSHRIRQREKGDNLFYHRKAVWIEDGEVDFYYSGGDTNPGCTILPNKKLVGKKVHRVKSIDFSDWLKRNFTEQDHILLKLDIEGAEYQVLRKMIDDKTILLVDSLYIDWHWMKLKGMNVQEHDDLVSELVELGIIPLRWATEANGYGTPNYGSPSSKSRFA